MTNEYESLSSPPYPEDAICCSRVAAHPSGELFVTYAAGELQLRKVPSGAPRYLLPRDDVQAVAFSADGTKLAVGRMAKSADIFDVSTGALLGDTEINDDYVDEVAWLGSEVLATGAASVQLQVHQLVKKTGFFKMFKSGTKVVKTLREADPEHHSLFGMAVDSSGSKLFVAAGERLSCIEVSSGRELWAREFEASTGHLAVSKDSRVLVMPSSDQRVLFLDASSGADLRQFSMPTAGVKYDGMIGDAVSWGPRTAFSPDGRTVALNQQDGRLVLLDAVTAQPTWQPSRAPGLAWVEDVCWLRDGRLLTACSDGNVGLVNTQSHEVTLLPASDDRDPEVEPEL